MDKNQIKRISLWALALLLGIFVVDHLGGWLMHQAMLRSHDSTSPKLCSIVYDSVQTHADVVFLGTSRTNAHFVPDILEDSLGMTVYNAGVDASQNIYSHYFVLSSLLSHHTPRLVCLGVDVNDWLEEEDAFRFEGMLMPFLGVTPAGDSVLSESGRVIQYKASHLFRYNTKSLEILSGNTFSTLPPQYKGYMCRPQPPVVPTFGGELPAGKVDGRKVKYLQRFVDDCRRCGVKVVFVVSPCLLPCTTEYDWLERFCTANRVPLHNYHLQQLFISQPDLFYDNLHLWDQGARRFSSIVAHDLKEEWGSL